MVTDMVVIVLLLFLLVFSFDVSFNLRRLIKTLDKVWRKLVEINESLRKY